MEINKIIKELEYYTGVFPRAALVSAIEQEKQIVPELLRIVRAVRDNPQEVISDPDYMGHIYALFLLSQFREKRAYEPVIELFSLPGELPFELVGDMVTENLNSVLASVSCGDDRLIKHLIENPNANEYVRAAALNSLVALVFTDELTRDSVVQYFAALFRNALEREPSHAWNCLVSSAMDLYPEELYDDVVQSFQEGLIDTLFISPEHVQAALDQGKETTLAASKNMRCYQLVTDTLKEMENWGCFKATQKEFSKGRKQKIARNQPCPCGSGKKYKKCCGKDADKFVH
jgi:hypothetical protein